jgi:hypothetical protein
MSRRVLNQDEIDDLLGFNVNQENDGTYKGHLRASRCDLQNEVADILEDIETLLEDAIDPSKRGAWRPRAVRMLQRLREQHMFD